MPADQDHPLQHVISTFETNPGACQDLLEVLSDMYGGHVQAQPGFVSATLHVNDAQTRIAIHSRWRRREDFLSLLRSPEMRERMRRANELCRSHEPVLYEQVAGFGAV